MTTIYPLPSYLSLLATCAPGFHQLPPNLQLFRPWSAPHGEPPFVSQNHAHSEAPPPQPGWTTQFNGVYKVCKHCMLTQSIQLGCSCAWASTQTHKLVQSMPMQKPYKCYNEGKRLHSFEPCREKGHPLMHPPCERFSAGSVPKNHGLLKSALRIWCFSHIWTFSWENFLFK